MKRTLILSLFLAFSSHSFSQKKLTKETINDFARAANLTYRYDMYGFKVMLYRYFHDMLNKDLSDAGVAVENIAKDSVSREQVLQSFDIYTKADKSILFDYLTKMSMKATTAKELAEYILAKYPN